MHGRHVGNRIAHIKSPACKGRTAHIKSHACKGRKRKQDKRRTTHRTVHRYNMVNRDTVLPQRFLQPPSSTRRQCAHSSRTLVGRQSSG